MPSNKVAILLATMLAAVLGVLTTAAPAVAASEEKILYDFKGQPDGQAPNGGLIFDAAGNLYGTTPYGGSACHSSPGCGTAFQLAPGRDGTWTETALYNFCPGGWPCSDGYYPAAGLVFDPAGDLYGTASGGSDNCFEGCGVVFQLSPGAKGTWTEKKLHAFGGPPKDGADPGSLIFDAVGNLYGTTYNGGVGKCATYRGTIGCGTVFRLTPGAKGTWTEKVLYSFKKNGRDGIFPQDGLVLDTAGNLYGTTYNGGANGVGAAFELLSIA